MRELRSVPNWRGIQEKAETEPSRMQWHMIGAVFWGRRITWSASGRPSANAAASARAESELARDARAYSELAAAMSELIDRRERSGAPFSELRCSDMRRAFVAATTALSLPRPDVRGLKCIDGTIDWSAFIDAACCFLACKAPAEQRLAPQPNRLRLCVQQVEVLRHTATCGEAWKGDSNVSCWQQWCGDIHIVP